LDSAASVDRGCGRRDRTTDDDVDLVLGDEAARVDHRLARIGGVVEDDQVDLLAGDRGWPELERLALRDAQTRTGAGERDRHADVDVGQRRHGQQRSGRSGGQGLESEQLHRCLLYRC
jgi:hypothetical protein